jgi:cytochrome c peroxidase
MPRKPQGMHATKYLVALSLLAAGVSCEHEIRGELPVVPVPTENPVTEAKRVLGKILFWDEQLSSDDTVACGTCHRPASGGADPRTGINPGRVKGSIDDVIGSPGIVSLDSDGKPVEHPVFGFEPQVSARTSPSNFGALWAGELFWDGRAGPAVVDPLAGDTVIASGGALENQALEALANPAEMAKTGRSWAELTARLVQVRPLALATNLPSDVRNALAERPTYAELFDAAFGNDRMSPVQIAFAIASYERTLVADQAPWDRYRAGDGTALTAQELSGWESFQHLHCTACHVPPLFTNNDFMNVGLRSAEFDAGRQIVSRAPEDSGDVKVPSLRNAGLRPRLSHTGEFATLSAALRFYVNTAPFAERDDIPGIGPYTFSFDFPTQESLRAFIGNALTDPRVAAEAFPFDRPTLRSERPAAGTAQD